jgi:hypothetical protein
VVCLTPQHKIKTAMMSIPMPLRSTRRKQKWHPRVRSLATLHDTVRVPCLQCSGPASASRPLPTPGSQEEGDAWGEGIEFDGEVEDGSNPTGEGIPTRLDAERAPEEVNDPEATVAAAHAAESNGHVREQAEGPTTASEEARVTSDKASNAPISAPPLSSAERYTAVRSSHGQLLHQR